MKDVPCEMVYAFSLDDPFPAARVGWSVHHVNFHVPMYRSLDPHVNQNQTLSCSAFDATFTTQTGGQSRSSRMAPEKVIIAYRQLYRAALKAVCYSQPASTVVRNQLRSAFRAGDATTFNERAIKRTIWFLNNAAKVAGTEHKVVKNVLMVKFWRDRAARDKRPTWSAISKGAAPKTPYVLDALPRISRSFSSV